MTWKPKFQAGDVVEIKGGASGKSSGERGTVIKVRQVKPRPGRTAPDSDVYVTRHRDQKRVHWTATNLQIVPEAADVR